MDKETWQFINTFAPWLSALGTISAVIISLYLATKGRRITLEVNAGLRTIVGAGGPLKECVMILVTNLGHRPATIHTVGWKIGFFRKKQFVQLPSDTLLTSKLNQKLEDGQSAQYIFWVKAEGRDPGWADQYSKELSRFTFPRLAVYSMKAQVHTSVGKTFEVRIEPGLRRLLIENMTIKT